MLRHCPRIGCNGGSSMMTQAGKRPSSANRSMRRSMAAAIALGMGLTLAGLGIASILLRHQVALRLPEGGRATRWLALSGPVFVIGIGAILLAAHLAAQGSF